MPKTTVKLTTWSLSKKKALKKLNDKACFVFRRVVDGLNKDKLPIASASVTPVALKGFIRYVGVYEISVTGKQKTVSKIRTVTIVKKPSKKEVEKTPKKVYKKQARDTKGRFKKKGK